MKKKINLCIYLHTYSCIETKLRINNKNKELYNRGTRRMRKKEKRGMIGTDFGTAKPKTRCLKKKAFAERTRKDSTKNKARQDKEQKERPKEEKSTDNLLTSSRFVELYYLSFLSLSHTLTHSLLLFSSTFSESGHLRTG